MVKQWRIRLSDLLEVPQMWRHGFRTYFDVSGKGLLLFFMLSVVRRSAQNTCADEILKRTWSKWITYSNSLKWAWKMTLIEDSRGVRTYYTRTAVVLAATSEMLGSWTVNTYRMSIYASANSFVDRLNTEGGRDPASWLTQTADKRREWATPADTNEQKQERLRKRRREMGADALLRLPIKEMRTCQHERMAVETTADKDTRLQQIKHKPKGYHLRVSLKRTSDCSRWVPISMKDWQLKLPLKEMPDFTVNERQTDSWERDARFEYDRARHRNNRLFSCHCLFFSSVLSKPRCKNPMQA